MAGRLVYQNAVVEDADGNRPHMKVPCVSIKRKHRHLALQSLWTGHLRMRMNLVGVNCPRPEIFDLCAEQGMRNM